MTSKYQEYKWKAGQVDSLLEALKADHKTVVTLRLASDRIRIIKKDGKTTIEILKDD
jgi:hypothetical protein